MTIARLDVQIIPELADDPRVVSALAPWPVDARLRALLGCLILRHRDDLAVFRLVMMNDWQSIIFHIDGGPTEFVLDCLDYLFDRMGTKRLQLTSTTREAGEPLRCVFYGPRMLPNIDRSPIFTWCLAVEDWRIARGVLREQLPKRGKSRVDRTAA